VAPMDGPLLSPAQPRRWMMHGTCQAIAKAEVRVFTSLHPFPHVESHCESAP
jgi:hypothetical protein